KDRADNDLHVEVQVARHLLQDSYLLSVFSSQKSELRLYDFEEFQDHSGDAAKVAGPRLAFQLFAQALDIGVGAKSRRVDFFGIRGKENVRTCGSELLDIRIE